MTGTIAIDIYILPVFEAAIHYALPNERPEPIEGVRWGGKIYLRLANGIRGELRNHAVMRAHAMLNPDCTIVALLHDGTEVCTISSDGFN